MSNNKESLNIADLCSDMNEEDPGYLVNALKRKIQSLAGQHCDVLESLSLIVKKRIEFLREIQDKYDELEAKCFEEKAAVEAKYQNLYQPLFTKRYEIVNGVAEVEGIANETTTDTRVDKERGVPSFWLIAMKNNDVLAEEISGRDEGALKFLKDIKWSRIENPKGFQLEFFFDSNPYFSNSVLTKTYHVIDEKKPILEKEIGTEIQWYPGKCLTQKVLRKKYKVEKDAKPIIRTETCESFFNFFNLPKLPEGEDIEDIDQDMAEELQNQMEQDYEIGSTIRDKIIPRAVQWFTGEAIQEERFEGYEDDDDDDEDDEEADEDEDDDGNDVDGEGTETKMKSSASKKSGRAQLGDGRHGEKPPECK